MTKVAAGWYDDGSGAQRWWDGENWTEQFQEPAPVNSPSALVAHIKAEAATGGSPRPSPVGMSYVVLQIILKEKLWGAGSGNLTELEKSINGQAALGYRLHTISTTASGTKGMGGGDRIQATLVFEKLT